MANIIEDLVMKAGTYVGKFQRQVIKARGDKVRPAFIGAMGKKHRWDGGDFFADEDAAQRRAITNSWFFSATIWIASEISAAGMKVVNTTDEDGEDVEINNHPFEKILRRPNPFMSRSFLWLYTGLWLKFDGNAYWYLLLNGKGELEEIWPLPANAVVAIPSEDPDEFIDYYSYVVDGREFQIPPELICHIQNFPNPYSPYDGLSELVAAMLPIDADLAMSRWNAKFFDRDNVMPSAIVNLKSNDPETPVNPADVEEFKSELKQNYAASERRTYVTSASGGVDVEQLGWSMRDMDFDAGRNKSRQEIFEIVGIPEGLTSKNATEANATVAERIFKNNVWIRTLVPIAEQVTLQVVIPFYGEGQEAHFNDIRIANREIELQEIDRAKGALTIDEVRKRYYKEGPLPNGEGLKLFGGVAPTQVQLLGTGQGQGQARSEEKPEDQPKPDSQVDETPRSSPKAVESRFYTGAMAAFFLPPEAAGKLYDSVQDDKLPASAARIPTHKLHVTLAFLGDSTELGSEVESKMVSILGDMAAEWIPLAAVISGTGTFDPKDGIYPLYAAIDPEHLTAFREELVARMKDQGVELASTYDFNPHVTIAYIAEGDPVPEVSIPPIPVHFDKLALSWGEIVSTYNLNGTRRPVIGEAKAELRKWREKVVRGVKRGKTPGEIEFTPEILSAILYEYVRSELAQAEDLEGAKAVFDNVRDSFVAPVNLGKQADRKGLTDVLIPVGSGQGLPAVEIVFGESDADTTFWDVKLPDYAGLLTADVVNRKSDEVRLITLIDGSDWVWDDSTKTYHGKVGTLYEGITIDLDGMLTLRDAFLEAQESLVRHYAIQLADGELSVQGWYLHMVGVIKQAYLAEFALSKGGLRNMTAQNWETLIAAIKDQIKVFTRFAINVSAGKLTLEEIIDRADVYIEGSLTVF